MSITELTAAICLAGYVIGFTVILALSVRDKVRGNKDEPHER